MTVWPAELSVNGCFTALRIKNLARLHLDDHFLWSRSPWKGVCHLEIRARDMKNGKPFERELGEQTLRLLRTFTESHRPHLVSPACRWLFARRDGKGPVDTAVLGNRISRIIRLKTGLVFNVHLARHLSGKLYLDCHPGGYEDVRQLLGHKHLSTTTFFYTGLEGKSAAKRFDRIVHELRDKASTEDRRSRFKAVWGKS